jgi:transposase
MAKPKLNDAMIDAITLHISKGNYAVVACRIVGINESTLYDWLKKAEERPNSIYAKLSKSIKVAESQRESKWVEDISNDDAWTSKAWLLERKHPERWGKKNAVDITSGGEKLKVVFEVE